ncbi:hypothetical protein RGUI_3120 [Rhodovulum sp. P5]|nr:hypothetical protein RGUI_3120 [Rhodovulum sp. P5]
MIARTGSLILAFAYVFAGWAAPVSAEQMSLFSASAFSRGPETLVPASQPVSVAAPPAAGASLFAGREGGSLFAPLPEREFDADGATRAAILDALTPTGAKAVLAERIRHLIGRAEAGRRGYDAVQHGATRRPAKLPTRMTIAEIYRWIDNTPGQPHAIGRYQFIPATLRRLVRDLGVSEGVVFSPQLQDRLADLLLEEAGLSDYAAGRMGRQAFMNNLAKIWAGLPTSSGKSHYHGYAGNRATMTWSQFEAAMMKMSRG